MHIHEQARIAFRRPAGTGRARSHWAKVALVAAVALAVIGGREGLSLPGADWLPALTGHQPIRAAVSVDSGREDCRIRQVIDGDTVDLDCPGDGYVRARLLGFDTPEVTSPECPTELLLGEAAMRALESSIRASAEIRVAFRGTDRYGRRLARLSLDGTDVARPMIEAGLARRYEGGRRRSWCS